MITNMKKCVAFDDLSKAMTFTYIFNFIPLCFECLIQLKLASHYVQIKIDSTNK